MPYGLKYVTQFDSVTDEVNPISRRYTLQFLFKDYTGPEISIIGGGITAVQRCTDDDPFAPIKGQFLDIRVVNKNSSLPITVFQSDDDDGVMVKLLDYASNVLWAGFLVQDDFYEPLIDYTHEITLSANDSLGLLKGVVLSTATVKRAFSASFQTNGVNTVVYVNVADTAFYPQVGNTIEFSGTSYVIATAVYEATTIGSDVYNWTITLTTATPGFANTVETIYLTGGINLLQRNSLLSVIAVCLGNTNIPLLLNIFYNLYEYRQDSTRSTFEQTLIDTQMFITGDTYMDCYTVLHTIMATFRCSIFQAYGQWNIISWDEASRYTNNNIPGFIYDETFQFLGPTVFDNNFFLSRWVDGQPQPPTRYLAVQSGGALRGWKFARKQFDFQNPAQLIKNSDLKYLGDLFATYVHDDKIYNEYRLLYFQDSDINTDQGQRYIRVVTDLLGYELERYLVLYGGGSSIGTFMARTNDIELNEGDIIEMSFSYRTLVSQSISGTSGQAFGLKVTNGTDDYWARNFHIDFPDPPVNIYPPVWDVQNSWPTGDINRLWRYEFTGNTNEWQSVTIRTGRLPISGLCNFYLANQDVLTPKGETHYKDFTFKVIFSINNSTKVIGQVHQQLQSPNKKLNSDVALLMDDSPRNSIQGTLFLNTVTNLLQDRTALWQYAGSAELIKLGQRTTFDELTWRQKTRSKIEGSYIGLIQNNLTASLLSMLVPSDIFPLKTFTFGTLTIDYKNNQFSGSLWEIYDKNDVELVADYTFRYIYNTT